MKKIMYFITVLLLFFILDYFLMHNNSISGFHRYPFYIPILYSLILLQLSIIVFTKGKILRFIAFLFLFLTYSLNYTYLLLSGTGFNRYEAMLSLDQIAYASDAFSTYSGLIIKSILLISIFLGLVYIVVQRSQFRISGKYSILPLIIFLFLLSLGIKSGTVTKLFPVPFQVVTSVVYAVGDKQYFGKREEVTAPLKHKSLFNKIVLLMDESIRGDSLSINNAQLKTTLFLEENKDYIFNYGIASSSVNCSTGSNIIVQSGLSEKELPDKKQYSLKQANIFQYMKKAGYTTVFIDGQNKTQKPIHAMSIYDFDNIDIYYQVYKKQPNIKQGYVDIHIAEVLPKILKKYKKVFVYVNKAGSHFHYEHAYPSDKVIFSPHMKEDEPIKDKVKLTNSYYNAIHWTVDEFFKKLFSTLKTEDVLVLYTSDHGQNLLDDGKTRTHCSSNPVKYEGNVPFIIVPFGKDYQIFKDRFLLSKYDNYNKLSHFNIFPTLIYFAGYDITKDSRTIFDKQKDKRYFYAGDIWGRTNLEKVLFNP